MSPLIEGFLFFRARDYMKKTIKISILVLFIALIYIAKDIVFHEYKYWQCTKTKELIDSPIPSSEKSDVVKNNMRECLSLINGVKEYTW